MSWPQEHDPDEILALRKEFLTPNHGLYYKQPIAVVEGRMQYLFDSEGKQYLDAIAGIVTVSVGHCHPDVIDKTKKQIDRLQHITNIIFKRVKIVLTKPLGQPCTNQFFLTFMQINSAVLVHQVADLLEFPFS